MRPHKNTYLMLEYCYDSSKSSKKHLLRIANEFDIFDRIWNSKFSVLITVHILEDYTLSNTQNYCNWRVIFVKMFCNFCRTRNLIDQTDAVFAKCVINWMQHIIYIKKSIQSNIVRCWISISLFLLKYEMNESVDECLL